MHKSFLNNLAMVNYVALHFSNSNVVSSSGIIVSFSIPSSKKRSLFERVRVRALLHKTAEYVANRHAKKIRQKIKLGNI